MVNIRQKTLAHSYCCLAEVRMLYVSSLVTLVQNMCKPSPDLCSAKYLSICHKPSNVCSVILDLTCRMGDLPSMLIIQSQNSVSYYTFSGYKSTITLYLFIKTWWHTSCFLLDLPILDTGLTVTVVCCISRNQKQHY